jgi:hypothetical protein
VRAGIADLVDALPGGKVFEVDLRGQNGPLIVVEQRKERDMLQFLGVARHRTPRRHRMISETNCERR